VGLHGGRESIVGASCISPDATLINALLAALNELGFWCRQLCLEALQTLVLPCWARAGSHKTFWVKAWTAMTAFLWLLVPFMVN
jgi:hypothetical protein